MSVDYHAWTHRPKAQGGTDPIEFAGPVIGERYKSTNQTINDSSYTQITSWDADPDGSNIEDASVIDTATNGLSIEAAGYYLISAAADWSGIGSSPVNAAIVIEVGSLAVGEEYDEFSSQTFTGDTGSRTSRVMALTYIQAGVTLTLFAYHESGSGRAVNPVTLKVVRLHADPPVPYWAPLS